MSVDLENLVADLHEEVRSRFFGKYRGVVLNVDDPEQMGRIQARVPEVLQEASSAWAVPCVPFAGAGHGLVLLPELGDGVWIEFEAGDIARPVWTGCWWGAG
ncbi:MAG TPA: phage baseplate assembly protein V, partial [Pyrinomonadaceae bacterium]|nr:phage baseplate assembly protein V [Pyrinomonadaceae bacterium]